jgi:hypothetical protein
VSGDWVNPANSVFRGKLNLRITGVRCRSDSETTIPRVKASEARAILGIYCGHSAALDVHSRQAKPVGGRHPSVRLISRAVNLRTPRGLTEKKQIPFCYDGEFRNEDTIIDSDGTATVPEKGTIIRLRL